MQDGKLFQGDIYSNIDKRRLGRGIRFVGVQA